MRKQLLSIIAFGTMGALFGSTSLERKATLSQINNCLKSDTNACKEISMTSIEGTAYMPTQQVLKTICSAKNTQACQYVNQHKSRDIASD